MNIPNGTRFVTGEPNPEFYLLQAMVELFPNHNNPNKQKLRDHWDACKGEETELKEPRPPEGPELSDTQVRLCKQVAHYINDYFQTSHPEADSIYVFLAIEALNPEKGLHWFPAEATTAEMLHDLLLSGRGIYNYAKRQLIDQTHIDPRFAILSLEAFCDRHRLGSLRMPTSCGMDVFYSRTPLAHYPRFDNQLFVPALKGYYGIVGKGGRDDD